MSFDDSQTQLICIAPPAMSNKATAGISSFMFFFFGLSFFGFACFANSLLEENMGLKVPSFVPDLGGSTDKFVSYFFSILLGIISLLFFLITLVMVSEFFAEVSFHIGRSPQGQQALIVKKKPSIFRKRTTIPFSGKLVLKRDCSRREGDSDATQMGTGCRIIAVRRSAEYGSPEEIEIHASSDAFKFEKVFNALCAHPDIEYKKNY